MIRSNRRSVLKSGAAMAGLLATGFPSIVRAQAGAIKIGHLTPLTGFLGALGDYAVLGIKMAEEEINRAGGVMGRPLEVMSEDSVNPATAAIKAQRMLDQNGAAFLMGEISSAPAIGAGFALTLCCDILVASQEAVFAMPEIDVGMAGGVKFLQRHFSPSKSRWLMLSGERLPAAELYRLGVIEACVPAAELAAAAGKMAATIAAKSPVAVKAIKDSFDMVESMSLRDGYRLEQNKTVDLNRTSDAREAKRAFIEKRMPKITGA